MDFLQRWDAECEALASSLLLRSSAYELPEVAGSQEHVVGRYFSFQGKSFVRSELWGYDQILNWGNQREGHKDEFLDIAKTNDKILKMSTTFKHPA